MSKKEVSPELVKSIKGHYAGVGTESLVAGDEAFEGNMPDGVTKDSMAKHFGYVTEFVAANVEAAGEITLESMKKDKKLATVTAEIGMGAVGKTSAVFHREKDVVIPPAEKGGEPTTQVQYGVSRVKVDFVAGRNNGLLGKARAAIKEQATDLFGPKK